MENRQRYKVFCPICGHGLFKSSENWGIDLMCPACKADIRVKFLKGVLTVSEKKTVAQYK